MIRVPAPDYTKIHMFLTAIEAEMLEELGAELHTGWDPGRQGGGYFRLDIKELIDQGRYDDDLMWLADVGDRALGALRTYTKTSELHDSWDAYLLFYPDGASALYHRDPAPEDMKHVRLNAIVKASNNGGHLALWRDRYIASKHDMSTVGEALIFSPSEIDHSVSPVTGSRLVLSVGCLVPA